MRPTVLFISEQTMKAKTTISDNLDSKVLNMTITMVQEEKILPYLGTALYNRLIAGITANNLTTNEQNLLNNYITNVMQWFVLAELPMTVGIKFYNRNILRKQGDQEESLDMSEMFDVMNYYKSKGEFQLTRLIQYLEQSSTTNIFPEYLNPGTGWDTIFPHRRGYTCPIVLDNTPPRRLNGYQRPEEYE
jgi:hypothetical protein